MNNTTSPVMNATQTLASWPVTDDAQRKLVGLVARHVNAQDKPCPVFVVRNGNSLEIRPTAIQSRAMFNALFAMVEKARTIANI